MAAPTLTQLLAETRYQCGDTDSANYAFVDADLTAYINRAYVAVKGQQDDRTQLQSATTSGASATVANGGVVLLTPTNIRRIVRVHLTSGAASTTPTGLDLERWDPWRAWKERADEATAGAPSAYAPTRQGSATAGSVGKWLLVFWRIPDATYDYVLEVVLEPTLLSAAGDRPDVDDQTGYALAWMAAGVAARQMGRSSEYIAHIEGRVPDTLKAAYAQMRGEERTP